MTTAADIDALYQPPQTRTTICLDSTITLEIERLEERLTAALRQDETSNDPDLSPGIAQQILDLKQKAKDSEVEFVFSGLGRGAYTDLLRQHPPTDEQKVLAEAAGASASWNADTFPPALLAASCSSVDGADEQWWAQRWQSWTTGEVTRLWNVCLQAQTGVTEVPKASRAFAIVHGSDKS